jgi:ribosome-binding ATPase YchF (GTP1/OBG family)
MRITIEGRPGAGKSALFDLLAFSQRAASAGEIQAGSRKGLRIVHVDVPDARLADLSAAFRPRKTTPARLQFQDLEERPAVAWPALSPERREVLAQSDLCLLVLDLFSAGPASWLDQAASQWRAFAEECVLVDLGVIEHRREKLHKLLRIGQSAAFPGEPELMERIRSALESGRPAREIPMSSEERHNLRGYALLSERPVLPAFNVGEAHLVGSQDRVSPFLADLGADVASVLFCAEVERQIQELPAGEQQEFLDAFGMREPSLAQVVRAAYHLAGLHCFFTVGEDEVRSWSLRMGANAAEAAGVIHSDLQKGFVRAEVLGYEDWLRSGSLAVARDKGLLRLEGREYVVHDGDILNIRSGLARSRG